VAAEHPLLVITDLVTRDTESESFRVALDVLRATHTVRTVCPQSGEELGAALARRGRRRPVVVGDEETLHAVVEALYRRDELAGSLLGWIPVGCRGGLARSLGISPEPAQAARTVVRGEERWLDLLVDDAGGIAVDSVRVAVSSPSPSPARLLSPRDAAAAGISLLLAGVRRAAQQLQVEADGTILTHLGRRMLRLGIGTVPRPAGGSAEAPPDPGTGLAEVVLSEANGPLSRLGYPGLHRPGSGGREALHVVRARAVTVSGREFAYAADGVTCGPVAVRTWQVEHSAWRLTVPAGTPTPAATSFP
jgi:diacylglycerol kinase (ATP)